MTAAKKGPGARRDADALKVHASLATLDVGEIPEPYRFGLPGSRVVEFPDPGQLDAFDAEEFLRELAGEGATTTTKDVLEKWLSPEDFEALRSAGLTFRQLLALLAAVQRHYGDIFGSPGELSASDD